MLRIHLINFILEKGDEEDRDYILDIVKRELDQHAYSTRKRINYVHAQTGVRKAYYRITISYTHCFNTKQDDQRRKTFFKLRLKYPDIIMIC